MKHGTVLIVDDDPGVRDILRDILKSEGYTVAVVGNGTAAFKEAERRNFNVAVVDYFLPPTTGLGLIRRLLRQTPEIVPILITGYPTEELAGLASRYSIFDYIAKPIDSHRLCTAIANALKTKKPTEQKAKSKTISKETGNITKKPMGSFITPLTPREGEIVNYIAQGYLNKQIAAELDISEQTVKNHVTSILRKLNANSRTEVAVVAMRRELISIN